MQPRRNERLNQDHGESTADYGCTVRVQHTQPFYCKKTSQRADVREVLRKRAIVEE